MKKESLRTISASLFEERLNITFSFLRLLCQLFSVTDYAELMVN